MLLFWLLDLECVWFQSILKRQKGFEVKKEPLIERLIKQLQAAGITDITVVVGFMKEQYEYLMDDYQGNSPWIETMQQKIISIHYNVLQAF